MRFARSWLKWLLKVAFSGTIIGLLLWRYPISLEALSSTFGNINWWVLALVIPLFVNQWVISALKWRVILRSHGLDMAFGGLLQSYIIGIFFSMFLPSSYGGDVVRITDVARSTGRRFESAAAVVLERLSGLVVLAGIGAVSSAYIASAYEEPAFFGFSALLFGILLLLMSAFVPGVLKLFEPIVQIVPLDFLNKAFQKVRDVISHYRNRPVLLVKIVLLSFAFQIMAYTIFYLYGRTIQLPLPYLSYFAFVPVVYLLEALPITIAGIGLREGALVYFLGMFGLPAVDAISLGIVVLTCRYALNLTGGVLFAFRRKLPAVKTPVAPTESPGR